MFEDDETQPLVLPDTANSAQSQVARGLRTVKLTRPMDAAQPDAPSCVLTEGGIGI